MGEARKIRDPVHGFVSLNDKEAEVVGTRVFQRLRGVRQLALASLAYPGALHTRFEHSLGVCHIAHSMAEALGLGEDEKRLVGLAALLHDVGHGPFSHVSEAALELYANRSKVGQRRTGAGRIHERITADLVSADEDLKRVVGASDCEKIRDLLSEGYGEPVLRAIVSGPADADKQDYLLRDSHFCGVKYGIFDMDQLHRQLRVVEDPASGDRQLAISSGGVHALEQFVLARYYLANQVYRHRVRLITDQMLIRAIRLGIEADKIKELGKLYAYDGSQEFLHNYVDWDDARFLLTFGDQKFDGKYCFHLLRRLRERRLLKQVYEGRVRDLPEGCRDPLSRVCEPDRREQRDGVEEALSEEIALAAGEKLDPKLVIIHVYTIKSMREELRGDEAPVIIDGRPQPKTFEEVSALFRSISEGVSEAFVEVYAPTSYATPREKRTFLNKLHEPITKALSDFFKERGAEDGNT